MRADRYDGFAESYARENESGLFNQHYARPAVLDLLGDVVASLVLHYLEGWSGPLAELRRVLKPGGRLIVVVNHPVLRPVVYPDDDYFAITPYTEDYTFDGQTAYLTFWHRPLHAMTDAFTRAGFRISIISEPPFALDTPREVLPPHR